MWLQRREVRPEAAAGALGVQVQQQQPQEEAVVDDLLAELAAYNGERPADHRVVKRHRRPQHEAERAAQQLLARWHVGRSEEAEAAERRAARSHAADACALGRCPGEQCRCRGSATARLGSLRRARHAKRQGGTLPADNLTGPAARESGLKSEDLRI